MSPAEKNRQTMVDAIAENMWNLGMGRAIDGTIETKRRAVREMAEEALALAPTKYETLPTSELNANKHFLVKAAIDLYNDAQLDAHGDQQDQAAAK